MINSINDTVLVLSSNTANIPFSTDVVRTRSANCCGWLNHATGSTQYQITEPGIYEILFNTNVTSADAGVVALGIEANGELLSGTEMDGTVATTDEYTNVATSRLIRVCNGANTIITVGSVPSINSVATQVPTIKNASLIIKKIA